MPVLFRSLCRWQTKLAAVALMGLVLVGLRFNAITSAQPARSPDGPPPFLEAFRAKKDPPVVTREETIASAVGKVRGLLALPDVNKPLPAILLLPDERGLTDWVKKSAKELAGIGYVVLTLDVGKHASSGPPHADQQLMAELSAAVRWLRLRPEVLPGSVGVVGWSDGAGRALAVAGSTPLQACVACYGPLSADPAMVAGLRATPLLLLVAGEDKSLPAFRKALAAAGVFHKVRVFPGAAPGFMTPGPGKAYNHDQAEAAWVELYNFFDTYVEDAPLNGPTFGALTRLPAEEKAVATIADLMRAINGPTGVRVTLVGALDKEPARAQQWQQIQAAAALIAEAGLMLKRRSPPRGSHAHWQLQADAFTASARKIVAAASRHDYPAARRGLEEVGQRCAVCHKQHR
jgi:carboxymethylenebutenolidase